jgi:hypothetical protein
MTLKIPSTWHDAHEYVETQCDKRTMPPGTMLFNKYNYNKTIARVWVARMPENTLDALVFNGHNREMFYRLVEPDADGAILLYHLTQAMAELRANGVKIPNDMKVDLS